MKRHAVVFLSVFLRKKWPSNRLDVLKALCPPLTEMLLLNNVCVQLFNDFDENLMTESGLSSVESVESHSALLVDTRKIISILLSYT